jgi:ubiquinone/menaquinone biosynthesis C-methylase UbiE
MIVPNLQFCQFVYADFVLTHIRPGLKWLDLGCGHQLFHASRAEQEVNALKACALAVGLDAQFGALAKNKSFSNKVNGQMQALPFASESFDLATANMVVEHLATPEVEFLEIKRVLKPGGLFIFHTPNLWGYPTALARCVPEALKTPLIRLLEGREAEDAFKTHYLVNTERAIIDLARRTDFKVRDVRMLASFAEYVVIPPLAILELLLIRLSLTKRLRKFRTNIIAGLERPA